MQKLSRVEKMWLIFFAVVLIGLIGGCMYDTVTNHKALGPRPTMKDQTQP
jgi:cell division protein FtsL